MNYFNKVLKVVKLINFDSTEKIIVFKNNLSLTHHPYNDLQRGCHCSNRCVFFAIIYKILFSL